MKIFYDKNSSCACFVLLRHYSHCHDTCGWRCVVPVYVWVEVRWVEVSVYVWMEVRCFSVA